MTTDGAARAEAMLALIMPSRDGRKDAKRVIQWDAAHPVMGYGLRVTEAGAERVIKYRAMPYDNGQRTTDDGSWRGASDRMIK